MLLYPFPDTSGVNMTANTPTTIPPWPSPSGQGLSDPRVFLLTLSCFCQLFSHPKLFGWGIQIPDTSHHSHLDTHCHRKRIALQPTEALFAFLLCRCSCCTNLSHCPSWQAKSIFFKKEPRATVTCWKKSACQTFHVRKQFWPVEWGWMTCICHAAWLQAFLSLCTIGEVILPVETLSSSVQEQRVSEQ